MNICYLTPFKFLPRASAVLALSSSLGGQLIADDSTWNGAGSGDSWATAGNWLDSIVPGASSGFTNQDEATFDTAGAGAVEIDAGRNLRYITFAAGSAGGYTFSGETLHMSHDGYIFQYHTQDAENTFQNDLVLHAADGSSAGQFEIKDNANARVLNFMGGISAGETTETVTLNLTGNNRFAATFSGVLADHATSGKLALNINHGVITSGGTTTLSAANTYSGGTTVNSGRVNFDGNDSAFGTGAITWNSGQIHSTGATLANDLVFNGAMSLVSSSVTFTGAVSLGVDASINPNGGTQTFDGVISDGTGTTFTRQGAGEIVLNAANTFTGGFIMDTTDNRRNRLGHDQALGTGTFVIKGGGFTGDDRTLANEVEWDGALVFTTTNYTFDGAIALGNDVALDPRLSSNGGTQAFNGVISDGSVVGKALAIEGLGAYVFNGVNTFTGGVVMSGNQLELGDNQALGTGTLTLLGSSDSRRDQTLRKNIGVINLANDIVLDGRHNTVHLNNDSGWNFDGALTIGTDDGLTPTLSFVSNESAVFNGVVSNGAASAVFTKEGSGTIIFGNDNTLTGDVVVAGGTLQIGNGGSTGLVGTSAVTVDDGSTLRFNRTGAYTAVNAIDGAGDLEIQGGGSASFSGALTHTGGTRVTGNSDLRIDGSFNGGDGISVEAGSTFGGSGSVELAAGNLTLSAGAFLAAGSESTRGVLNIDNTVVDLSAISGAGEGALVFRLGGEADSDRIDFGGTSTIILVGGTGEGLTFGDFAFSTDVDFTGGEYLLFENVSFFLGEELVSGETTGLINGYEAELFYVDNGLGGGDISLSVVVPEPAAAATLLGLLSLAGVSMRRRRGV